MAYPTGTLARTLIAADSLMAALKSRLQTRITQLAAGDTPSSTILAIYRELASDKVGLNTAKAVEGIAAYAQAQKSDGTLDVVVEFNAVVSAIDAALSWVAANFPANGGYLLAQQLTATGTQDRQFTAAQTADLRIALQAIVDLIN